MRTIHSAALLCLALIGPILAEETPSAKQERGDVYPRWSVVGEWRASHPYWTDTITFKADGTYRTGDQQSTGKWVLTADKGTPLLVMRWDAWGTESLMMVHQNHFRGQISPGSYMDMRRGDEGAGEKSGAGKVPVKKAKLADIEPVRRSRAQIEVVNMQPTALLATDEPKGWTQVPAKLTKNEAVVYMPAGNTNGVADIKVTADGVLILACNYDYQGNSSGNWQQDAWDATRFQEEGWQLMSEAELGGTLVKGDNRAQVLFSKQVTKGEAFRIRCNKHDPPFPILITPQ